MLLGIDVGNTHTVIGIFDGDKLLDHWRISTSRKSTADEFALILSGFFRLDNYGLADIDGVIVSSVVPEMSSALECMSEKILKVDPVIVSNVTDTGVPLHYSHPKQMGADRLVNAAAGIKKYGVPCILIDFGTATTFDAINKHGEYTGGAIAPGVEISANALFQYAARLTRVELSAPVSAIGSNTMESIQAGIIFGTAGQVDRLVEMIKEEIGAEAKVIATGGLAEVIVGSCKTVDVHDPLLTLDGLKIIYDRNQGR